MPCVLRFALTELPCPNCGSELTFLDQYRRHYCYRCQRYAPEGYGERGAQRCPNCGGVVSYVAQYDRFYCYRCNSYPDLRVPPAAKPAGPAAEVAPVAAATPAPSPTVNAASEKKEEAPAPVAPSPATPVSPVEPTPAAEPPQPSPEPVGKPAERPVEPVEATPAIEAKPAEAERVPSSPYASMKPAALRVKVFGLKKAELMDLCKDYGLDPTGTKEQLQERLLAHLRDRESKASDAAWTPKVAEEPRTAGLPASPPAETGKTETITGAAPVPATRPVEIVQAKIPEPEPAASAPAVVVEETKTETAPQAVAEEPALIIATPGPVGVPVVVEEETVPPRIEHPCPTCGRELSFISQYGRWYCYFCQRYAPSARTAPKFACPSCGATLRWIPQYERWWCDRCEQYASADLPRPRSAARASASASAAPIAAVAAEAATAATVRRQGGPGAGIALIVFGLFLFVLLQVLTTLAPTLGYVPPIVVSTADAALMEFGAFVLVAVGAILGLAMSRRRG